MRPRERVLAHLKSGGEVTDPGGMASTVLAGAVGYTGSSVAFAQLLSAMERSGLIEREIRGRRTYRIRLVRDARPRGEGLPVHDPEGNRANGGAAAGSQELAQGTRAAELDYDTLARRLLAEVVRRLGTSPSGPEPEGPAEADLARTVASLEHKLASVQSRQLKLREENTRLREMLTAAERSLAEHERRAAVREAGTGPTELDAGTVQVLERLLSSLRHGSAAEESAQAG